MNSRYWTLLGPEQGFPQKRRGDALAAGVRSNSDIQDFGFLSHTTHDEKTKNATLGDGDPALSTVTEQ